MNPQPCIVCGTEGPRKVCAACMIEHICNGYAPDEFIDAWVEYADQEG